jgi:spermidine/putrescine transport system ATP-binding protein
VRFQANAIIDAHVFSEGDTVDVGFSPSDCVLLGEDDWRLE